MAGLVPVSGGYACAACGARRERGPGQVVLEVPTLLPSRPRPGAALGTLGFGALFVGVTAGILLWAVVPGVAGAALAAVAGVGGLVGLVAARRGAAAERKVRVEQELRVRENGILDLAEKEGGDLTATAVARAFGISIQEADDALTGMADGARVSVELDPDGVIHYVFRELAPSRLPPRIRVSDGASDEALELVEAPAAQRDERREG